MCASNHHQLFTFRFVFARWPTACTRPPLTPLSARPFFFQPWCTTFELHSLLYLFFFLFFISFFSTFFSFLISISLRHEHKPTMSEAALTNGPVAPSLGSSLLPHHNSTTTQIGPSPAMTDLQRSELERYMSRDALFLSAFEHQRQMQSALLNEKQLGIRQIAQSGAEIFGPGYHPACGNGTTIAGPHGNAFQIVYPAHRRRARKSKAFTL